MLTLEFHTQWQVAPWAALEDLLLVYTVWSYSTARWLHLCPFEKLLTEATKRNTILVKSSTFSTLCRLLHYTGTIVCSFCTSNHINIHQMPWPRALKYCQDVLGGKSTKSGFIQPSFANALASKGHFFRWGAFGNLPVVAVAARVVGGLNCCQEKHRSSFIRQLLRIGPPARWRHGETQGRWTWFRSHLGTYLQKLRKMTKPWCILRQRK